MQINIEEIKMLMNSIIEMIPSDAEVSLDVNGMHVIRVPTTPPEPTLKSIIERGFTKANYEEMEKLGWDIKNHPEEQWLLLDGEYKKIESSILPYDLILERDYVLTPDGVIVTKVLCLPLGYVVPAISKYSIEEFLFRCLLARDS